MNQIPISDFPLKWRWVVEKKKLLNEHLSRIFPTNLNVAKGLWERSSKFYDKGSEFRPSKRIFNSVSILETPHTYEKTDIWIRNRFQSNDLESIMVWVSWKQDLAIKTDMEIIALYWDTFCYEGSDDTSIFPETEEWLIQYWHKDRLYYATSGGRLSAGA